MIVLAVMSSEADKVTLTVRLTKLALCTTRLVVTPVVNVTVHSWYIDNAAVAEVKLRVANSVPEL